MMFREGGCSMKRFAALLLLLCMVLWLLHYLGVIG